MLSPVSIFYHLPGPRSINARSERHLQAGGRVNTGRWFRDKTRQFSDVSSNVSPRPLGHFKHWSLTDIFLNDEGLGAQARWVLEFNAYDVLGSHGKTKREQAERHAIQEYEKFRVIQDLEYKSDFDKVVDEIKVKKILPRSVKARRAGRLLLALLWRERLAYCSLNNGAG
jgi:hypothetical protein